MSLGHGSSIVRNGLVLHLDAANIKSYPGTGTAWSDLSNNTTTTTLFNSPTFSSNNGGHITFNTSTQYSQLNQMPITGGSFTAEIFFKPNDDINNRNIIYAPAEGGNTFRLYRNNAGDPAGGKYTWLFYYERTTLVTAIALIYVPFTAGEWAHTAFVVSDNGTALTYKNGVLAASASITSFSRWLYPNSYLNVGYPACDASISSFKLYNRELTAQEIQQNFEALRGRYNI